MENLRELPWNDVVDTIENAQLDFNEYIWNNTEIKLLEQDVIILNSVGIWDDTVGIDTIDGIIKINKYPKIKWNNDLILLPIENIQLDNRGKWLDNVNPIIRVNTEKQTKGIYSKRVWEITKEIIQLVAKENQELQSSKTGFKDTVQTISAYESKREQNYSIYDFNGIWNIVENISNPFIVYDKKYDIQGYVNLYVNGVIKRIPIYLDKINLAVKIVVDGKMYSVPLMETGEIDIVIDNEIKRIHLK